MPRKKPPTAPPAEPAAAEPVDLAAEIERRTEARMAAVAERLDDGPTWAAYVDLLRLDDPTADDIDALCDIASGLDLSADDIALHRAAIAAEAAAVAAAGDLAAAQAAAEATAEWWAERWRQQAGELARHRAEATEHQARQQADLHRELDAREAERACGSIQRRWPRLFGLPPETEPRDSDVLPGNLRNIETTRGDRRNRP